MLLPSVHPDRGANPLVNQLNYILVSIDADYLISFAGKPDSGYQTNISSTNNRNLHLVTSPFNEIGGLVVITAWWLSPLHFARTFPLTSTSRWESNVILVEARVFPL